MKNSTRSFVFTQIERLKIVSGTKTSIFTYATSHNAPYLPTKILHNLCFSFLLGITAVQEKLKTMLVQNFGGQIRCIMGNVEVACATN